MRRQEPDVSVSGPVANPDSDGPLAVVGGGGPVAALVAGLPGRVVVEGAGLQGRLAGEDGDAVATSLEVAHLAKDVVHVGEVGKELGLVEVMTLCVLVYFLKP